MLIVMLLGTDVRLFSMNCLVSTGGFYLHKVLLFSYIGGENEVILR